MIIKLSDHFNYGRLMRFVLPTIGMLLVTSLYSIVDGFFVSNIVGKNAFAAVNLVMPYLMAVSAIGFMIGTGGNALVSKTIGEGDREKADRIFSMLIGVVAIAGSILTVISYILMPQIVRLLGGTPEISGLAVLYGRVVSFSGTFFMMQNCFESFLVTAEKPKMGLWVSLAAGFMNAVLDYVLMVPFRLGILGAAIATVLSQATGALIPLIYFLRPNSSILHLTKASINWHELEQVCLNGSSELLSNLSESIVGMLYNFELMKIAGVDGIAAYGVIMYLNFIFMTFFFGYAIGAAPLIGYNYGAQNHAELGNLYRKSLIITACAALAMTFLSIGFASPLSRIFVGYDKSLSAMTAHGMRLYSLSFLICGFNIFGSAFFTALGNGGLSALISVLRTLVLQIAAILILPVFFGVDGIWTALVAAEALTLCVTVFLLLSKKKFYGYA